MNIVKTLFFDLDDTIYDRSEPFLKACSGFFPEMPGNAWAAYLLCNKRGNEVFHASQRGEISMNEMYIYRYCRGFADAGIRMTAEDALAFQALYREEQKKIRCTEEITQLLEMCSRQFRMGMITNGPAEKQRGKIRTLGIEKYFERDLILVSGEVKVDKPDPAIFRLAEKLSGVAGEGLTYIGDSFSQDIIPATEAGWKTVWYNRRQAAPSSEIPESCTVVNSEAELYNVIAANQIQGEKT